VAPLGLMVGKMIPYGALAFVELCAILAVMRLVFQVPIHGNVFVLLAMSIPFLLTVLGIGLVISTKARTQAEAFQLSMGTILPSVFLSGFIFMIDNMPPFFQVVSRFIPATYYIEILRGIILRGAGARELWINAAVLTAMGCAAVLLAARQFVRQRST
jgi:ABC-2 type transport system permease protein